MNILISNLVMMSILYMNEKSHAQCPNCNFIFEIVKSNNGPTYVECPQCNTHCVIEQHDKPIQCNWGMKESIYESHDCNNEDNKVNLNSKCDDDINKYNTNNSKLNDKKTIHYFIEIGKAILSCVCGILLLYFSVYYTIFVFYPGIDSISVGSFIGGIFLIFIGIEIYEERYNISTQQPIKTYYKEEHNIDNKNDLKIFAYDYISKINILEKKIGIRQNILEPFFIDSRNILSIQNAAKRIADFIGLKNFCFIVSFVKQKEGTAGIIELNIYENDVFIEISDELQNSNECVLAVLAHEITHKYMEIYNISVGQDMIHWYENEILTDITTVFLGLGKIVLNGYYNEQKFSKYKQIFKFGYLELNHIAFVYRIICDKIGISKEKMLLNLSQDAINAIDDCEEIYNQFTKVY